MKKNYFKKLISAVIALLMIFPATPGYMAGAQEIEADADEMIISPDFESGFSSESTTPAAITYNVLYNDNTGFDIPELAEGPYHEGEEVTVVENTFVNEGYSFSGWNSSPDGEGDGYEPGDILIMPDHDVTLFAQWEAESILMAPLMLPSFVSTSLEFSKDADTDVLMTTGYSTNGQTEVRKLWVHNDIIYVATIGYLKDITRIEFNGVDVGAFNVYSASDRSVPLVIDSVPYYVDGLDPPTKRDNSYWIVVGFSLSSDITFTSPFTLSIITEATGGHGIDSVPVSILNGYMINYYIDGTETRVPDISPNPDMETSFLTGWVDLPPHPTSANYTVKAGQPTQIYLTGKDDYINIYYVPKAFVLTVKHVYDGTEDVDLRTATNVPYDGSVNESKIDKTGFSFSNVTTSPDLTDENISGGNVTGKMPLSAVTITFYYTRNSNNLTVKHVYDGTEDTTITTTVSTPYNAAVSKSKVDKAGFTFSEITTEPDLLNENITAGTVTGNMPNASVIITFTYTRDSNNLTVKHVYDGTEDTTITTTVSTPYDAAISKSKVDKTGFTFSGITTEPDLLNENITAGTVTGNMPNASVIITFTYTRDSNNLTVKHVYDGTEDTSLTTTVSTPYEAAVSKSKIDKTGFTFSGITTEPDLLNENITAGTVTGNMPNASVIITFTYTRDSNNLTVKHVYDG
ncbi:MAG: InlB B-repeat-containing protein, partial [Sedimentibacter sp.]|uniref:InlB B-repeat-containing protein n=1 Tax=Sedimentibacter sp. TaxID=1960295 RepID=UPI0031587EC2